MKDQCEYSCGSGSGPVSTFRSSDYLRYRSEMQHYREDTAGHTEDKTGKRQVGTWVYALQQDADAKNHDVVHHPENDDDPVRC